MFIIIRYEFETKEIKLIEIPKDELKYYYRFYNKHIKYTDRLYTKEELFFLSLTDDNFLNCKSYNKFTTLTIRYRDNILSNSHESIRAKYYYTVIKALLSNAKRFDLIPSDTNAIPRKLLYDSMKILNKSSRFTKIKFNREINSLKHSKLFSEIDKQFVCVSSNKMLFDGKHYLYSDRIISKKCIFSETRFIKECIYFLKSKPLSTSINSDLKVITNKKVSIMLQLSDMYVSKVIKNMAKVYRLSITNGVGYYATKDRQYSFKLMIQGEIFSSRVIGSRMYANIYFKSKIKIDGKIHKKNKIVKGEKGATRVLKLFKSGQHLPLCRESTLNLINKKMRPSESYIQSNKSIANHKYIKLNIIGKDLKHIKDQTIKICHLIEFSHHLQIEYKKFIKININRNRINEVYKHLFRHHINLKNRNNITNKKFKAMRSLFEEELGHSVKKIDRTNLLKNNI